VGRHPLALDGFGGLLRWGVVDSLVEETHRARVKFAEIDGGVSYDLPVLVTHPGDYSLPPVGAAVLCAIPPGTRGDGFVLGTFYTDEAKPPGSMGAGKRSIAGDDLRLGASDASDAVALAPKVKDNADRLHDHLEALERVIQGAPIPEPGNGAPSALQAALQAALAASPLPDVGDVAAGKVKAS